MITIKCSMCGKDIVNPLMKQGIALYPTCGSKKCLNEVKKKYHQSKRGKEVKRKYNQSERGKEIKRKYRQSEKYKDYQRKYQQKKKQEKR